MKGIYLEEFMLVCDWRTVGQSEFSTELTSGWKTWANQNMQKRDHDPAPYSLQQSVRQENFE